MWRNNPSAIGERHILARHTNSMRFGTTKLSCFIVQWWHKKRSAATRRQRSYSVVHAISEVKADQLFSNKELIWKQNHIVPERFKIAHNHLEMDRMPQMPFNNTSCIFGNNTVADALFWQYQEREFIAFRKIANCQKGWWPHLWNCLNWIWRKANASSALICLTF